jgi:homoserine dehydrogenase
LKGDVRIALVGFGNVGRRFASLLLGSYGRVLKERGVRAHVTGIATGRHGSAIDPRGLPLARCLRLVRSGGSLGAVNRGGPLASSRVFVARVPADVLVEITPLDRRGGEPATSHVRLALKRGLDVVTANKGPVAFAFKELTGTARRHGRRFLHEGAVMDGTPVFNMARYCLPGVRVLAFRGTLNSTTNLILSRMGRGATLREALREAQALGIVEADPTDDLDGWDSAVKGCALANALMGADARPGEVRRQGIGGVSPGRVREAARAGKRVRLVVRGDLRGRRVHLSVRPEGLPLGDPLAGDGPDTALLIKTDLMGEIGLTELGGSIDQTAYALLADLLTLFPNDQGVR